ncbi:MAG: bifunctional phosphoribosylaminoimidazolecarboxamide formyltransferase/IMP cyclohydrolase [Bacteroidetes bacterium]|nr:bifunctional phosphoribosylaminoimidazolecarboxamide formyltransferase/IMP cyclohydrolase [Bacteroidota bacterium]
MPDQNKIGSALISVYHKDGLAPIIELLHKLGVVIYATGGTQDFITAMGVPVVAVENITDYPSILGGRVKTLHPKVFGGILGRRENSEDLLQLENYKIPAIDLVIVDLYPFEKTVASNAGQDEIIEKIDVGGISLIRAAAKNFNDVVIIPSLDDYAVLLDELKSSNGCTSLEFRRKQAAKAFAVSSHYDTAIHSWFVGNATNVFKSSILKSQTLRYGENPHQQGVFYGNLDEMLEQLAGRELSYNNLLDIDAALSLANDFKTPVTAILKHNNACGVATGPDPLSNWKAALAADPVSAFGGIIVTTSEVNEILASEIGKLFFEVLIAPSFTPGALQILMEKKNRILLQLKKQMVQEKQFRTILNGVLWQERDSSVETEVNLQSVTSVLPTAEQIRDLLFANAIVKHSRSNTIVIASESRLIAAGVGQTSRVDALEQAIEKARKFGLSIEGAVMASDAFFPFPDCVEIAHKAGIKAVIQPGGSKKDQESIDYCNKNGLSMVFTGVRHFRH